MDSPGLPEIGASSGEALALTLPAHLYAKEAVLAAAYAFADRCWVQVLSEGEAALRVCLQQKVPGPHEGLSRQFHQELIDQQLRHQLEARFGPLRALIYEQAFAPLPRPPDSPKGC